MSLNLHIKRKHKGGNKSDRERFAREVFLSCKNGKPLPETKLLVPADFVDKIKLEFERLKKIDFEEEFDPSNLFRYNISNFDNIMRSHSDDDYEDLEDADSIDVAAKNFKNDQDSSDDDDDRLSVLSGARSEGVGRREPLQQIMKDITTKKLKR